MLHKKYKYLTTRRHTYLGVCSKVALGTSSQKVKYKGTVLLQYSPDGVEEDALDLPLGLAEREL
jgi:hypothetical protein